ncbi:putative capsid protein [Red panda feces-associated circular DNA virus 21]|uniref:Putative capsid protein n=1 Tax=Red panda feces-associated circular DNA virus 21 TaxID=2863975 RepID=A0A8K1HIC9_9VIRU|nr:putative capsid protein [Red panda feces-associated circular DNA virus 21]
MAFRKRVYAGSRSGPRKRARFMKRRRFSRRRRTTAYSSQRGNTVYAGFRGRKMPFRKYKRVLWNASTLAEHHRSVLMKSVGQTAPSSNILQRIESYPMIPDSFWSSAGGSVDGDLNVDGDIFIRGGITTLRVRNNGDAPVQIIVWKIRTTANGTGNVGFFASDESAMWDPTVIGGFERFYRVKQRIAFSVEPNDSNALIHRLFAEKIEAQNFNPVSNFTSNRDYWIVGVNSAGSTEPNCTINYGHNLSFTTDRF